MNSSVFWDVMLYNPLKVNRHFERICHLSVQGQIISQARYISMKQLASRALLSQFFDSEEAGDTLLQNISLFFNGQLDVIS
jgi:hypothetical protein